MARNTPPRAPTSSPRTTTRSSASISSQSVSWIVWMMFFSVEPAAAAVAAVSAPHPSRPPPSSGCSANTWRNALSGSGSAAFHAASTSASIAALSSARVVSEPVVVDEALFLEVVGEQLDRVVGLRLLDLLAAAVRPVVVIRGVREEPVGLELDQRRPAALPGLLDARSATPRSTRADRSRRRRRRRTRRPRRASATSCTAICLRCGTLIAYRLFSQNHTTGSSWIPEKFRPSCQSPSLVAPSPNQHPTTASSPRYFTAYAAPAACGICVAIGEDPLRIPSRREPQCAGIWRPPLDGSSRLPNTPRNTSARRHPNGQADSHVAVVGEQDVGAAREGPCRTHLAALVARDRDHERRLPLCGSSGTGLRRTAGRSASCGTSPRGRLQRGRALRAYCQRPSSVSPRVPPPPGTH